MTIVDNKYYTPDISEFIQGFRFEILERHSGKFGFMNFSSGEFEQVSEYNYEFWNTVVVWWKYDLKERIVFNIDDCTWNVSGYTVNWFAPYTDEMLIELIQNGKVRAVRE